MFYCELCGFKSYVSVCTLCESEFILHSSCQHPNIIVDSFILYSYCGLVRHLIHSMKFRQRSCIAKYFGISLGCFLLNLGVCPDVVLPVPLHARRFYERGFNQSLLIAYQVAKILNAPLDAGIIYRYKNTKPLSLESNRLCIFDLGYGVRPHTYNNVLVIDDVITTGSTLNSIIKLLNCKDISVAAVAGA